MKRRGALFLLLCAPALAGELPPECRGERDYSSACLDAAWGSAMKVRRAPGEAAAAPPAKVGAAVKTVDLTALIPGAAAEPNKGAVGACHAFAAAAMLNAAYLRQYGESVEFSPADILLQGTAILNPSRLNERLGGDTGTPMMDTYYWEGGWITLDFNIALEHGVAKAEHVPYNEFLPWYTHTLRPATNEDMAALDRSGALTRILNLSQLSKKDLARAAIRRAGAAEMDENRKRYEKFLAGREPQAENDRRESAARFQGFAPRVLFSDYAPPSGAPDAEECRAAGAKRSAIIVKELDAGRPAAVAIDNAAADFGHEIVIDGYAVDERGALVFKTLNSWGPGKNYAIPEEQMCHVSEVTALYVPRDGAPPPLF